MSNAAGIQAAELLERKRALLERKQQQQLGSAQLIEIERSLSEINRRLDLLESDQRDGAIEARG